MKSKLNQDFIFLFLNVIFAQTNEAFVLSVDSSTMTKNKMLS
jgi:hypothetical protein